MYPEANMVLAMRIWQLPDNKKHELSQHCNSKEYFAQEKVDGFWYQFEKTDNYNYLFSRTVSAKDGLLVEKSANVPHLTNFLASKLPPKTTIIGEIYYPGKTSKDATVVMGCLPEKAIERQKDNPIYYYLHDIIQYDGINLINVKAELRYKILSKIWELHELNTCKYLRLADFVTENIEEYIENILSNGGEGVVLKQKKAIYYPDKKPAWTSIKVKKHGDADVVCMGFCDATKYYDGKLDLLNNYGGKDALEWPYWVNEEMDLSTGLIISEKKIPINERMTIRGTNFRTVPVTKGYYYNWKTSIEIGAYNDIGELIKIGTVSSGLDDSTKEEISKNSKNYLNKVIQVGYMEKDFNEKTLRHPTFELWRFDKNSTECTLKEIFEK